MSDDNRPLFEQPLDDLLPLDLPKRSTTVKDPRRPVYDLPERELVVIARLQQWMVLTYLIPCLLFAVVLLVALAAPRDNLGGTAVAVASIGVGVIALGLAITALVLKILLAVKLFQPTSLALLLVLEVFCGLGVVTLLIVNARATATLKRNGIRVGLLGVRTADLPRVEKRETTLPKLGW